MLLEIPSSHKICVPDFITPTCTITLVGHGADTAPNRVYESRNTPFIGYHR